jgi:hypothetical protein
MDDPPQERAPRPEDGTPDDTPPGWSYNPSAWSERIPIVVLGVVAMGFAGYLTAYQFGWVSSVWDPFFGDGTERVLLSHALVRSKAYGDSWGGLTSPGRLEWTLRVGAACLFAGVALWMIELDAPSWAVILTGVAAGAVATLEAVALTRRRS